MMNKPVMYLTVDVEEWFNILDIPGEIPLADWARCENRLERNLDRLLELFANTNIRATFFWLGYFAARYPQAVQRCVEAGHEIACHGYAHVLAHKVGREAFREDIRRGKNILEEIVGVHVNGFRAAGFCVTEDEDWFFDEVALAGFRYDSSVFPAISGHGGIPSASMAPYRIETVGGPICEIPQSVVEFGSWRLSLFGGGYLRLSPMFLMRWGAAALDRAGRPLIIYVHPREIDPDHPRLKMNPKRYFKSYINLKTTYKKLQYLCENRCGESLNRLIETVLK